MNIQISAFKIYPAHVSRETSNKSASNVFAAIFGNSTDNLNLEFLAVHDIANVAEIFLETCAVGSVDSAVLIHNRQDIDSHGFASLSVNLFITVTAISINGNDSETNPETTDEELETNQGFI